MCILCVQSGKMSGGLSCIDSGFASADPEADQRDYAGVVGLSPDDVIHADTAGAGGDTTPGSVSTAVSLSDHTSAKGYINSSGDQDWYRLNLLSGHTYTFAQNGFGTGAIQDPYLRLFTASGAQIAFNDDAGPLGGALLKYTVPTTGTYYISAGGFGSHVGQYLLTVNDGTTQYNPTVSVPDVADYLTNSYWEVNGETPSKWSGSALTYNLLGLEPERAALARIAFQAWSDVCNLTFAETSGAASITLDDTVAGSAYESSVTIGSTITAAIINVSRDWYSGIDAVYSYTLQTFIHEIGHALGLGHAGPYNGSATYGIDNVYANDSWQISIMSYMDQIDASTGSYRFVMTPAMADIMAAQRFYGAPSTRAGDTVYGFGSNAGYSSLGVDLFNFSSYAQAPAFTIFDAAGADTLNASGYSQSQRIDLRGGAFSNIGGFIGNVGIYTTALIENAVGGSGADTILGNSESNRIWGGAGNDSIDGGLGIDREYFSGNLASYSISTTGGVTTVSGPDGTDTLINMELLTFADQTARLVPLPLIGSDLNGDYFADLLWGSSSGEIRLWTMKDAVTSVDQHVAVSTNWHIIGTNNFDADGKTDLLLREDGGALALWQMNGSAVQNNWSLPFVPNSWHVEATGDFNGDALADLLWRADSGEVRLWEMNGPVTLADRGVALVPNNWHIVGVADFTRDGLADLLWREEAGGGLRLWQMDGGTIKTDSGIATVPTNWHVEGTGDFDGDGYSDLLWRADSGEVRLWEMNGAATLADHGVASMPNNWHIEGVSDFNGNGQADIFWRSDTGESRVWDMDGKDLQHDIALPTVAPDQWRPFFAEFDLI